MERRRGCYEMLCCYLKRRAGEWESATEPFIDDYSQRVLITRRTGIASQLLRSHIGDRPSHVLLLRRAVRDNRKAEIAEQNMLALSHQHIFWLDISMDHFSLVCIVQRTRHLFEVGQDRFGRENGSPGMCLAQATLWGVLHHEK